MYLDRSFMGIFFALFIIDFLFRRFLFVVLVDTACWAPIIAMKVFVFFSYEISGIVSFTVQNWTNLFIDHILLLFIFVSIIKYLNGAADVYAFLVVFVLPLNSAVNPILYTFTTTKYRNQVLLRGWKKITSQKWQRNEGSGHTGSGSNQGTRQITDYLFIEQWGSFFFCFVCVFFFVGRSMTSYLSRNRKTDEPLP